MDEPHNPLDSNTPTIATVTPNAAGPAAPDLTQEAPGRPPAVPGRTTPSSFGRYEVRRSLGAGGFGEVYLAHDTELDRLVALKVIRARSVHVFADGDPALLEARQFAKLHHPGIVVVHDVGVHAGRIYVVSDYVDGPDLGR